MGSELGKKFPGAITPDRETLDITNKEKVLEFVRGRKVDVVIHAAAITSVRKCEEEKDFGLENKLGWN